MARRLLFLLAVSLPACVPAGPAPAHGPTPGLELPLRSTRVILNGQIELDLDSSQVERITLLDAKLSAVLSPLADQFNAQLRADSDPERRRTELLSIIDQWQAADAATLHEAVAQFTETQRGQAAEFVAVREHQLQELRKKLDRPAEPRRSSGRRSHRDASGS